MGNCSCKYIFLKVMLEAASISSLKPSGLSVTGMTLRERQWGCAIDYEREVLMVCIRNSSRNCRLAPGV